MTNARKNANFPIVLKTIINDAHRDNKSFTLNDKQIRARIRANAKCNAITSHVKNTSHVARNQREYDAIRCAFDVAYANKIANASKRASRKSRKSTMNANVETNANVE